MTSQWRHRNKTRSCYSELNYVENLYVGFFIFWKLTELCRFVTYSWDDPRAMSYAVFDVYAKADEQRSMQTCGTLFWSSCAIQTSHTDCSDDSWMDTFFWKHEHGLTLCDVWRVALEKHVLTYLLKTNTNKWTSTSHCRSKPTPQKVHLVMLYDLDLWPLTLKTFWRALLCRD